WRASTSRWPAMPACLARRPEARKGPDMASITPLDAEGRSVPKGSKVRPVRYVARWRTPDGKSREKWFDRKLDAENFLTSIEHRKLTGEYVDPQAGRITV